MTPAARCKAGGRLLFEQTNPLNAGIPRVFADAFARLERTMAPFTLWQLLNQRQPFDNGDDSDAAPQQQSAGQAIGQSLIDRWNRAEADAAPGPDDEDPRLNHLVAFSDPPGTALIHPQLLPNVPSDQFGIGAVPALRLLAAGNSPAALGDPLSEGQVGALRDPNIHSAQAQALPYVTGAVAALLAGAAEWSRQQMGKWPTPAPAPSLPQSTLPSPPYPDPAAPSPGQSPAAIDGSGDADTAVPVPSSPSASPSAGQTIGDFTVGSESPFEDSDFLPRFDTAEPQQRMSFPGDYSRGRHNPFVNFQIDSLRKAGCIVEPNMRLGSLDDPRIAIADWMYKCFDNTVPTVADGKTGRWGKFTTNQNVVYPAVAAGRGYSPSPRIESFGYMPWSQLPPLPVMRSWSPWHGAPVMDDYPFGGGP